MPLPDRVMLPLSFDPNGMLRDLVQLTPQNWIRHFVERNYIGEWSAVALRAPADETHPVRMIYPDPSATSFVNTPLLETMPHCQAVLARLHCPLLSVRLMRLTPGSAIKPHRDLDLDAQEGMARLHVPICTGPGVVFQLNGRAIPMAPGECWYLRLSDEHSVVNAGADDRIHLVIDVSVNTWLMQMLQSSAQARV